VAVGTATVELWPEDWEDREEEECEDCGLGLSEPVAASAIPLDPAASRRAVSPRVAVLRFMAISVARRCLTDRNDCARSSPSDRPSDT
jgi:hypothetical protein